MAQKFAKLTDKMVERARRNIGRERPARNPWAKVVSQDAINHFAWGIGDLNPLWLDEEYARNTVWGTIVAPPTFPVTAYWGPIYPTEKELPASKGQNFPGIMGLYSGSQFTFYEPIRLNDKLDSTLKYVGIVDSDVRVEGDLIEPSADVARAFTAGQARRGAFRGRAVDEVRQHKHYVSGKLVAVCVDHRIRVERGATSVDKGKYRDLRPSSYTEKELERIAEAYEKEFRRGREVLHWEDVNVGQELPAIVKGPLTITSLVTFCAGAGGPFNMTDRVMHLFLHRFPAANFPEPETNVPDVPERAHWDRWMAGSLGWPRGYDFGQQSLCALGNLVTNWMGDDAFLRSLTFWRMRPWFLYETMWVHGRVTNKEKNVGEALVHVDLWAETQAGEKICTGSASVVVKTRSQE